MIGKEHIMKARCTVNSNIPQFGISLISVVFVLLVSMMLTGCAPPPLSMAAESGNIKEVEALLNKGVDVNQRGGGGVLNDGQALEFASSAGHLDIVRLLLDRGATIDATHGNTGWTALSGAAWKGHTDVAKLLIERGSDIDKAIYGLDQAVGTGRAIKLLEGLKREGAAGRPAMTKPSTEAVAAPAAIRSDVDELPAGRAKSKGTAYAVVIGIEQYRQKLPKADFATQDAKVVSDYLTKMLGYPEENVISLTNDHATYVDLVKYFEKWLPNNVEKDSTVFIYYSGHGAPDPKTGDAFLVPYDGDPAFIDETGYSLKRMYTALGKLPAREVIVTLDSCFSGAGGRSVIAKGSRPLVMNLQIAASLPQNVTVLSASAGNQTSSTFEEKGHGLFTYFMLKGIKNEDVVKQDGTLDIPSLYEYVKPQVSSIARKKYNNEQTPQLMGAKKQ
jgi:hypothetical protein